jgi:hypothetical protein
LQLEVLQQLSGSTKIVLKCTTYSSGTQSVR